jgi:hypothetical protein
MAIGTRANKRRARDVFHNCRVYTDIKNNSTGAELGRRNAKADGILSGGDDF